MLIENKFIYLNLPRCASTSFHIACLKNKLDVKYYDDQINASIPKEIPRDADSEYLADNLVHKHERIVSLKNKFGNNFPVISVKRDPYERYISLWKHIIDELYRVGEIETFELFKSLDVDQLLSYKAEDIHSNEVKYPAIKEFLKRTGSPKTGPYVTAMIYMIMSPTSHYHNHDNSILWFDIKNLNKLENWVSEKLGFNFKLEKTNSSQHFECNIINDEYFRKKYDSIYKNYDNPKNIKSLM